MVQKGYILLHIRLAYSSSNLRGQTPTFLTIRNSSGMRDSPSWLIFNKKKASIIMLFC